MKFENKTIIITGGSSGIGAATVELFSCEGATVYVLDKKKCKDRPLDSIYYLYCDVSNIGHVKRCIKCIHQKNQYIDFLFCNAGIHLFANIEKSSVTSIEKVVATNFFGTIFCLQQVLPVMKKQGFGAIVLMSSDQAFIAKEECAIYGATKAAIAQLAKSTALDYAPYKIRVNCVCPGTIETPMYQTILLEFQKKSGLTEDRIRKRIAENLVLKRVGKPEEVANVVSFLCSEAASFITGALVPVDGGYTIQ